MNVNTASKKITILIDSDVYRGLQTRVGKGNIGKFISKVVRTYVSDGDMLAREYKEMSRDKTREKDATVWSENLLNDFCNEK